MDICWAHFHETLNKHNINNLNLITLNYVAAVFLYKDIISVQQMLGLPSTNSSTGATTAGDRRTFYF